MLSDVVGSSPATTWSGSSTGRAIRLLRIGCEFESRPFYLFVVVFLYVLTPLLHISGQSYYAQFLKKNPLMDQVIGLTSDHLCLLHGVNGFPEQKKYAPQNSDTTGNSTNMNVHNGQRKLLISEVQLLTRVYDYMDDKKTPLLCVYAGAYPCLHLTQLLVNFPDTFFVLIDPAFQASSRQASWSRDRVVLCSTLFDDESATAVKNWTKGKTGHYIHKALNTLQFPAGMQHNDNLVFVSDIRRDARNDAIIATEMTDQARWFRLMNAKTGLMKFRLPYVTSEFKEAGKFNYDYMKGTVYLPIWGRKSTTECRLYVERGCVDDTYFPIEIEKSMSGFNVIERRKNFSVDGKTYETFDKAAEILVLSEFCKTMNKGQWKWCNNRFNPVRPMGEFMQDDMIYHITCDLVNALSQVDCIY
jgi:hypothetical protein